MRQCHEAEAAAMKRKKKTKKKLWRGRPSSEALGRRAGEKRRKKLSLLLRCSYLV
jgi:hypothetical protein